MPVFVVNPGSSSLKLHVLDDANGVTAAHEVPIAGGRLDPGDVERFLSSHRGVAVDPERNGAADTGDRDVATAESRVRILIIQAREDQEIAREVRRIVG